MPVKDGSHANNRVESEAKSKGTIEYALRPYRIPTDVLREEHGAVLGMVTKLLGESHTSRCCLPWLWLCSCWGPLPFHVVWPTLMTKELNKANWLVCWGSSSVCDGRVGRYLVSMMLGWAANINSGRKLPSPPWYGLETLTTGESYHLFHLYYTDMSWRYRQILRNVHCEEAEESACAIPLHIAICWRWCVVVKPNFPCATIRQKGYRECFVHLTCTDKPIIISCWPPTWSYFIKLAHEWLLCALQCAGQSVRSTVELHMVVFLVVRLALPRQLFYSISGPTVVEHWRELTRAAV